MWSYKDIVFIIYFNKFIYIFKIYYVCINVIIFLFILVFSHDIFSEKQPGIQHKKNIPSLFESDSESEIESYHLNDNVKSN